LSSVVCAPPVTEFTEPHLAGTLCKTRSEQLATNQKFTSWTL
jgi:hypothetical protein